MTSDVDGLAFELERLRAIQDRLRTVAPGMAVEPDAVDRMARQIAADVIDRPARLTMWRREVDELAAALAVLTRWHAEAHQDDHHQDDDEETP